MDKIIAFFQSAFGSLGSRKIVGLVLMAASLFGVNLPPEIMNEQNLTQLVGFLGFLMTLFGNGAKANIADAPPLPAAPPAPAVTTQSVDVPAGYRAVIVPDTH